MPSYRKSHRQALGCRWTTHRSVTFKLLEWAKAHDQGGAGNGKRNGEETQKKQ